MFSLPFTHNKPKNDRYPKTCENKNHKEVANPSEQTRNKHQTENTGN